MKVKNWEKFQHYKHRDPPWIRLYRGLLNDVEWHNLDGWDAKALVMIWLIASESDGVLPSKKNLAFRLRLPEKQVSDMLARLSHWLVQDDSTTLAPCEQLATPETETETETEQKEGRANARKLTDRKRKTDLPTAFVPDWESARAAGLSRLEAEREFQKFKNHAAQNGRTCVDWQAAWRNWCIKAAEFMGRSPPKPDGPVMATLTVKSPGWNPWKSHYRDTGKNAMAAQMDRFASEDRAMTFPSEFPPGHQTAA